MSDSIHARAGIVADVIPDNQKLEKELHKPIIRKFKKRKVYSFFKNNIRCVDLGHIQFTSKYKKE